YGMQDRLDASVEKSAPNYWTTTGVAGLFRQADRLYSSQQDRYLVTEKTVQQYLDEPDLPDVDLFLRSSGEQRTSNFMIWQAAYVSLELGAQAGAHALVSACASGAEAIGYGLDMIRAGRAD
ncbi:undecaprenyl diphosphate synthase family protein, partial [Isoptericola haloaureus]